MQRDTRWLQKTRFASKAAYGILINNRLINLSPLKKLIFVLAELFLPGKGYKTTAAFKELWHLFGDVLRGPLRNHIRWSLETGKASQRLGLFLKQWPFGNFREAKCREEGWPLSTRKSWEPSTSLQATKFNKGNNLSKESRAMCAMVWSSPAERWPESAPEHVSGSLHWNFGHWGRANGFE